MVMHAAAGTWDGEALVKSKHAETLHQVTMIAKAWPRPIGGIKMSMTLCLKGAKSSFNPAKWLEVSNRRLHS